MTKIRYTRIQRFCLHDGPGIRTTVFLFGCNMRCPWCCNPENLVENDSIPVHEVEPEELARKLLVDRVFFGEDGGVTISGGEPLLQTEGLVSLMKLLKDNGVHVAVETALMIDEDVVMQIAPHVDLFIVDFKPRIVFANGEQKRPQDVYLDFVGRMERLGKPWWLRTVYIDDATTDGFLDLLGDIAKGALPEKIEVLPRHDLGRSKMSAASSAGGLEIDEKSRLEANYSEVKNAPTKSFTSVLGRLFVLKSSLRKKPLGSATTEAFKREAGVNTFALTDRQVRDVQNIVWAIAQDIIDVCEKNGFAYFMDGGSCLGAVRHQGFIPWDDDIDIAMPRFDYDRFIEAFKEEHGAKYWVHELGKTKGHLTPQTMIRLKGTMFRGKDDFETDEAGIYVDIYPIENVFGNPVGRIAQGVLCDFSLLLLSCRKFSVHRDYYMWFAGGSDQAVRSVKRKAKIGMLLGFVPLNSAVRFAVWASRLCKNDESSWVSIPSGWEHFFGGLNKRSLLFPTISTTFEDRQVAIPHGYREYLEGLYGENYMSLPPEEDRERHIVSCLDLGVCG